MLKKGFPYGERLRKLRLENHFTQEEIALRAEITTSYYGQLERGKANPSVSMLEKICAAMGVSISDIFTDENDDTLGIDAPTMQILRKLNGRSEREKEIILEIIKSALRLQSEK